MEGGIGVHTSTVPSEAIRGRQIPLALHKVVRHTLVVETTLGHLQEQLCAYNHCACLQTPCSTKKKKKRQGLIG